jgi:hypothetical protein
MIREMKTYESFKVTGLLCDIIFLLLSWKSKKSLKNQGSDRLPELHKIPIIIIDSKFSHPIVEGFDLIADIHFVFK